MFLVKFNYEDMCMVVEGECFFLVVFDGFCCILIVVYCYFVDGKM